MTWRRWLSVWAVLTLGFGVWYFLSQDWPGGYDPLGRCFEPSGSQVVNLPSPKPGEVIVWHTWEPVATKLDRWPPHVGTRCLLGVCPARITKQVADFGLCGQPRRNGEFVSARPSDFLLLSAYAAGTGLVVTFLAFGIVSAVRFGLWTLGRLSGEKPRPAGTGQAG